ncbi:MAG: trypsin-like peptidase domain-containing protein [Thermoguttaceae bacterium]
MRDTTAPRIVVSALWLFVGAVAAWGAPPTLPAALLRPESSRPEQRAELQRELDRNAKLLEAQSAVVRTVAKLVGPAVVHIEADIPSDSEAAFNRRRLEEAGSGVIIQWKENFYVLTNRHVVRGASPEGIRIHLADGRRLNPKTVLEDEKTDVAVLPVSAPDLVAAPIGDSDRLEIGDFVLAVGSPFGLSHSVTFGIISAKGRRALHLGEVATVDFQDFLQTDAAINPGNSGGPLIGLRGEVVGINTAIASNSGGNEGIGFAIPINMFMAVGRQLIETGTVTRAFLGVNLNSKFGPSMAAELGLPRPIGAHVTGIRPGTPAEAAKLQVGDVILEFNHTPVEDDAHLVNLVSLTPVGKTVPLLIFRDRKPITILVEVDDRGKFSK